MKKLLFTLLIGITTLAYSQAPQKISYQGVARNISGTVLANQPIGIRFDIHQGSASGAIVFTETHTGVSTNAFGLFTTYIGSISNLSVINWATNIYFIEVSIDPNTGTFSSLGSQQLMSVPYALNAGSAPAPAVSFTNNILSVGGNTTTIPAGTTYTAGTGINVAGSTITNTAPDQTITITPAGSASVTGTYPNFIISTPIVQTYTAGNGIDITAGVISNTATAVTPTIVGTGATTVNGTYPNLTINTPTVAPDQTVTITGMNSATVTGAYPNFTVNVPSGTSLPNALSGQFLYHTGTVWDTLPRNNLYFNGSDFGIGTTNPQSTFHVVGAGRFDASVTTNQIYANNLNLAVGTFTNAGEVLTNDGAGNAIWQAIPTPSLAYNNGTNVLSLTQGTTVTTATLNGTGSNTVSMVGSGLATVTPTTGSTFTVSVPNPTLSVGSGSISISGGNSVAIPSSSTTLVQGNNVTLNQAGNTYTINSVTPTLSVVGGALTGSYPTQTLTIPASSLTTLTQSTGVVVTGTAPNYTLSSPNQSLTINSNSLSITGGNTITLPPSVITGLGTGIATVTTSVNNFTVNVPSPTYTAATGVLSFGGTNTVVVTPTLSLTGTTLTSGASTNSVNLASLPGLWSASSTTAIVQTNTLTNVGIGMPSPAPQFKLDVAATAGNSVTIHGFNTGATDAFAAVYGENNNNGIGVYAQSNGGKGVFGKSTSGSGVYGESTTGDGGKFILSNNATIANAVNAQTNGTGAALYGKSFNATPLAAKFDGSTEILHTATQANPTMHLREITGGLNRIKFSNNTVANKFFETAAQTNAVDANGAYSINYFDGTAYKSVLLVTGERKVSINNLNTVLASLHVMENATTAGGGVASEGFARAGQINIIRNNQPALAARTAVIFGDELGRINFAGYDGVAYGDGAKIYARASENVTSTSKGTDMYFAVVPNATMTTQDIFKLGNDGIVTVNPSNTFSKTLLDVRGRLRVDSSLTMAAYNTPPNTSFGNEGRIYYDRPTNKFKVSENGGAYVDLIPGGGATPWTQGAGVVFLTNGSDNVGIGTTTPVAALDVTGNLRLSGSQLYLGAVGGINSGYTGMYETGTDLRLAVFKGGAPGTGFAPTGNSIDAMTIQYNTGNVGIGTNTPNASLDIKNNAPSLDGLALDINNATNGSNGLQLRHFGTGNAAYIEVNNPSSGARMIEATSNGTGIGIRAQLTNSLNTSTALFVSTNGGGVAIQGQNTGTSGIAGEFKTFNNTNTSATLFSQTAGLGTAGFFENINTSSNSNAVTAVTYGTGSTIFGNNQGTAGHAGYFNIPGGSTNPDAVLFAQNIASGTAVEALAGAGKAISAINSSSTSPAAYINNSGIGDGMQVFSSGNRAILAQSSSNGTAALEVNNTGNGNAITGIKGGTATSGNAGAFTSSSPSNSSDGVIVNYSGAAAAIHAVSAGTSTLSLFLQGGHIKAAGATVTIGAQNILGGFSSVSTASVFPNSNDIKGTISFNSGVTGFATSNYAEIEIRFAKGYSAGSLPAVILTPLTDMQGLDYMVSSVGTASFFVRVYRSSNSTIPATVPANSLFKFSYLVIE